MSYTTKKARELELKLKQVFPNKNINELTKMVKRCVRHIDKEITELSIEEELMYSWLLKNCINARTAYRWLAKISKVENEHYNKSYAETIRNKYFLKLMKIKEELKELIPEIDENKYQLIIMRCKRFKYKEIQELKPHELKVLKFLEYNKLNPLTVWRWFGAFKLPDQLKEDFMLGKIPRNRAVKLYQNKELQRKASLSWQIIEEAKKIVNEVV